MNKMGITARQQWIDVKDALSLQTLSIHGRLKENIGIGGIFFNDKNGFSFSDFIFITKIYLVRPN